MDRYDDNSIEQLLLSVGLPDDLPERVLAREPEPSRAALKRIKSRTLLRTAGKTRWNSEKKRRRVGWWKGAVAVLLMLVLAILLNGAGGSRVWAGLQKALALIPGFGTVEQGENSFILVSLEQPRVERGGGYAQLAGMLAQPDATYVKLFFKDLAGYSLDVNNFEEIYSYWRRSDNLARRIYLADDQGTEYRMERKARSSWDFSENRYGRHRSVVTYFTLQLPPLPEQSRRVTVVVPVDDGPDLRLTVNLLPPAEAALQMKNIQSAEINGVRVTAGAHFGEETWISLAVDPPHEGSQIIGTNWGNGGRAELTGCKGGWYPLLRSGQTWQANFIEQFHKQVVSGEEEVALSVKIIHFQDRAETRIKLPIPREGCQDLDIPVSLGRFNFTITGVESQYHDHGEKRLIIYLLPDQEGPETFYGFSVSTGFLRPKGTGSHWRTDESGEMEYSIPVKENRDSITLMLHDPIYQVEGPWSFTFPVVPW